MSKRKERERRGRQNERERERARASEKEERGIDIRRHSIQQGDGMPKFDQKYVPMAREPLGEAQRREQQLHDGGSLSAAATKSISFVPTIPRAAATAAAAASIESSLRTVGGCTKSVKSSDK